MKSSIQAWAALLTVCLWAAAGAASARQHQDHEAARAALARGEILPLTRILTVVAQRAPGDILEVELDRDNMRFIYEITVLSPAGKVVEVRLDAKTAAVIDVDDVQDAREKAMEKAEAAREKAMEKAQAAREEALEKAQAAREQARETSRDARADRRR